MMLFCTTNFIVCAPERSVSREISANKTAYSQNCVRPEGSFGSKKVLGFDRAIYFTYSLSICEYASPVGMSVSCRSRPCV